MTGNFTEMGRRRLLIGIAIAVLAVYSIFSLMDARSASKRLDDARQDFSEVASKLVQIDRLKTAPRVAALQLESPAEITNRISAARESAGLAQSSLLREQPSAPQRVGRSDFELRSTTVQLAPSTLDQILKFCDSLRDEETGTVVRDLRLSVPQNRSSQASSGGKEEWEAEMILTQMIFSPKAK